MTQFVNAIKPGSSLIRSRPRSLHSDALGRKTIAVFRPDSKNKPSTPRFDSDGPIHAHDEALLEKNGPTALLGFALWAGLIITGLRSYRRTLTQNRSSIHNSMQVSKMIGRVFSDAGHVVLPQTLSTNLEAENCLECLYILYHYNFPSLQGEIGTLSKCHTSSPVPGEGGLNLEWDV